MQKCKAYLLFVFLLFTVQLYAQPQVHFVDVGTGDATIIDDGEHEIIIDGGLSKHILHKYVMDNELIGDGKLELMILTHPDPDHYRGLVKFLKDDELEIVEYWDPGFTEVGDCEVGGGYKKFLKKVKAKIENIKLPLHEDYNSLLSCPTEDKAPRTDLALPDYRNIKILYSCNKPMTVQTLQFWFAGTECAYLRNNASIVLRIEFGDISFLLSGDANGKLKTKDKTEDVERLLLNNLEDELDVDVFKVPHHGSATASSKEYIEAITANSEHKKIYAVLSAGNFPFLPNRKTWSRLQNSGFYKLFRTDKRLSTNNDHIICTVIDSAEVVCNYK